MKTFIYIAFATLIFWSCSGNTNEAAKSQNDEQEILQDMKQSLQDTTENEIVLVRDTTN
jgi:PBP1b-binding outer membrane lipoprotein LpoB